MKKRKLKIMAMMCLPLLAVFCIVAIVAKNRFVGDAPVSQLWRSADVTQPASLANWPWKNPTKDIVSNALCATRVRFQAQV